MIPFLSLDHETIRHVVDKFLIELETQLSAKKVDLDVTDEAKDWLAEHGYDEQMGARPMARLIQETIKAPLADAILFGSLQRGGQANVVLDNDKIDICYPVLSDA